MSDNSRLFLLASDAEFARQDLFPPSEPVVPISDVSLRQRLSTGANDRFRDLVIIGWQAAAVPLLLADGVTAKKRIIWLIRPEQAREALEHLNTAGGNIRLAVVHERASLATIFDHCWQGWSMSVLDETLCPPSELHLLSSTNLLRKRVSFARLVQDTRAMIGRVALLKKSVHMSQLRHRHRGATAICVAAGPSLDRHIDFLRQLSTSCVIIAVDVVQQQLQKLGIPIDYLITVDSSDLIADRFSTAVNRTISETTLVMPINGNPRLDQFFSRRCYFPSGGWLGRWLLNSEENLPSGTTVGVASVGLACYMGVKEIVLLGHDLSYGKTMYSTMVQEGQQLDDINRGTCPTRQVLGNNGSLLPTDYLFEIAIDDFRLLLANFPNVSVYNPNINDAIGAQIPFTKALPENWIPAVPWSRNGEKFEQSLMDYPIKNVAEFHERLRQHGNTLTQRWRVDKRPIMERVIYAGDDEADLALSEFLLIFMSAGFLGWTRVQALPPSIGKSYVSSAIEQLMVAGHTQAIATMHRLIDENIPTGDLVSEVPHFHHFDHKESAKKFWLGIRHSLALPSAATEHAVLLVQEAAYLRSVLQHGISIPIPTPQSALEGLLLLKEIMPWLDQTYVSDVLCMATLEGLEDVIDLARSTQCINAEAIPDSTSSNATRTTVKATNAVMQLRQGQHANLREVVNTACVWPPCHLHVIRGLLTMENDEGHRIVCELLERKIFVVDDQIASIMLLHYRDFTEARKLIQPFASVLGEASQLALAQRCLMSGDHASALRFAQGIRVLSRFRDQALAIIAEVHLAAGDQLALQTVIAAMASDDLRKAWETSYLAMVSTSGSDRFPEPGQMAQRISTSWKQRNRRSLLTIVEELQIILSDQRHLKDKPAWTSLFTQTQVLLKNI